MATRLKTYSEEEGGTYAVFARVLGLIALLQVAVVLWFILFRFDGQLDVPGRSVAAAEPASSEDETVPSFDEVVSDVTLPPLPVTTMESAPPPVEATLPKLNSIPETIQELGKGESPLPNRIENTKASQLVDHALRLREQGDTQGALTKLKEADQLEPNHPKILAEIATTYGQMGLEKRAKEFWAAVHEMGIETAGAYWDLADMALRGQVMTGNSLSGTVLKIARHVALEDQDYKEGQKVILRVHLAARGEQEVDLRGQDMFLQVLFYDLVNGKNYDESIADTVPHKVSAPYDWADGAEEIIEVEYRLPELTTEQRAAFGEREYFGYVVELYYKDVLQDVVANPRTLARK